MPGHNHGGFENSVSTDSVIEGIAEIMPVFISEYSGSLYEFPFGRYYWAGGDFMIDEKKRSF
jgi:hypothetical protein